MSWSVEVESPVFADRMFEAAILDWHNLGPKLAPEIVASGSEEGNIRELNFTSVMPFSLLKERLDNVDHEKLECLSTITEGGFLGTKLKSATTRYTIEPASDTNGCIVKVVATTELLPGVKEDDMEGDVDKAKEAMVKQVKAVEAYLLNNPNQYVAAAVETPAGEGGTRTRSYFPRRPIGTFPDMLPKWGPYRTGTTPGHWTDFSRN